MRFLGRPPSPRHARTKKQHFIQTQAEQDALEKKGAALKKKEAELQAREAKLERMLADVAKQRDLIKSADKELKEQEEAFRQQQLAAAARGVARTSALMSSIRLASDVSSRRSASGPAPAMHSRRQWGPSCRASTGQTDAARGE